MCKRVLLAFAAIMVAVLALAPRTSRAEESATTMVSSRVGSPPRIDGVVDGVWSQSLHILVPVSGGSHLFGGATTLLLKSVYTDNMIYFLAQWSDPSESLEHQPWQKQADGTWRRLISGESGDEDTLYEDQLALLWPVNVAGFGQGGCAVLCHGGEGQPARSMYASHPGEMADLWQMRMVRTNPAGQMDDQYIDATHRAGEGMAGAVGSGDPSTGGGFSENADAEKRLPAFTARDQPAPPYWILEQKKRPFSDRYQSGDRIASTVDAPFQGDRGDLAARAVYANGGWTVEWGRKLQTGSQYDQQFSDQGKTYDFALAVFDHTQARHAISGPLHLAFGPPTTPGALARSGRTTRAAVTWIGGSGLLVAGFFALRSWRRAGNSRG